MEQDVKSNSFRGFELYNAEIPVEQETCQLCTNHCKITVAKVDNQIEAFGFLCGRDYDTKTYIPKEQSFNLLKQRKKVLEQVGLETNKHTFTIGIPAALHMVEDITFWKNFFNGLGIKAITSEGLKNPVRLGKNIASAEFCTPILSLHGHIAHLMDKTDFIFLPLYFEEPKESKTKRLRNKMAWILKITTFSMSA